MEMFPTRVLILHNRYQVPGGEDTVARGEAAILRAAGFTVDLLETDNDEIVSVYARAKTALQVAYSFPSRKLVAERISPIPAGSRARPQPVSEAYSFGLRCLPRGPYPRRSDSAQLSHVMRQRRDVPEWQALYRMPGTCISHPGNPSRLLSRQQDRNLSRRCHDWHSPCARHLEAKGELLHRAHPLCP